MPASLPRLLSALLLCASLTAGPKDKRPTPAPKAQGPVVDAARLAAMKARSIGPAIMGGRVSDIAADPVNPDTFYVGLATGGVWKTANAGATFSPLFDKQPVVSIGALAVAPSDPKIIWVGTGEANDRNSSGWGNGVYRSTDGGATWAHVGLAGSRAIPRIVVHPKEPATAWVAAMGDLWNPGGERGLFKTTDGGKTWKAVLKAPGGLDTRVGCGKVVLDPSTPDTLYAGTEAGLYASLDRGATWMKLGGLPAVAVDDLQIQPREHDLVIATHGRSLYVLDDGDETPSLSITNAEGQPVATFPLPRTPGLGRVAWNLRPTKTLLTEYGGLGPDKFVRPGTYTATLTVGAAKVQQKVQVTIAPGIETR